MAGVARAGSRARVASVRADAGAATPPLPVVSAQGVRLKLADGRELIDGMASWWCAIHGYRHPVLDAAVSDQLDRMAHVMFGGLTHEPAIRLAERLTRLDRARPRVLRRLRLASPSRSRSSCVLQYWHGERRTLLTWRGGYHGDTFGAMAVCDPDGGMHSMWQGTLAEHVFAPLPALGRRVGGRRCARCSSSHELAGVIVEPIVQGAGGMRFHPPRVRAAAARAVRRARHAADPGRDRDRLRAHRRRCSRRPSCADILCLGKALTGGYMTLAATLCTAAVAERLNGPLMHGPTFMANPLATAAALASTGSARERFVARRMLRGSSADCAPARAGARLRVSDVRVKGAIGVIELDHAGRRGRGHARSPSSTACGCARSATSIYAMPPYVTDDEDVARIAGGDGGGMRDRRDRHRHRRRQDVRVRRARATRGDGLRQGRADRRRRRRGDRARALRRRRPHARPLPRAAGARDGGRARGRRRHHARRRSPTSSSARHDRVDRSRAPAGCSCASTTRRHDRRRRGAARRAADRRRPRRPRHAQPHRADRRGDRAPRPRAASAS